MESSLITSAVGIVKLAWAPISRHFGYLICYKSNINELESKFKELDALRKDVQEKVDAARRERLEVVNSVVQIWLGNVDKEKVDVEGIKHEASTTVTSSNCFLHIKLHYKLGRKAAHHMKTITELKEKGMFDSVAHKGPPPSATDLLLFNEDYMIFDSRKSCEKKILEALKVEAVHLIGLWGMAGGGKTTLVKEVSKQAKKQKMFDEVVMVTVSQNIDLKRIQKEIAAILGLTLEEDNVRVVAVNLAKRLTTTQNTVLVILDDLWDSFNLSDVGIQLQEMGTNCKVVITTRNKDVCEGMRCREMVELKTLSDEESWSLFKSRAGDAVESPTMRKLAQKVVRECAGLPLALVVLGTALKNKSSGTWETVLMRLKTSKEVDLPGVSNQLYQSIKLSFDFLERETFKSCFLHCCLYPEDWEIPKEALMHMMVGGGLLADVETLNGAQSLVNLLLDQLKACGLLLEGSLEDYVRMHIVLEGSHEGWVRMHDVARDVAIQIGAATDHAFYVKAGQGLEEWPTTVESETRRLSLMNNEIKDLSPDPMQYPKLKMLILSHNNRLSSIPEMFFLHMRCLMVLDLSYTRITSLPESVSCLTNLRVLNLRYCSSLKDISHINGLKMLEILILDGCRLLSIVPKGVGWTQNLRFVDLDISMNDYFSKEFTRFHRLEQLFMGKFEGSFRELIMSLRYLTHLFINQVVDLDDPLSHELGSPSSCPDRLVKFRLSFAKHQWLAWNLDMGGDERELQLMGTKPLTILVKRLLEKTKQLTLIEFQETKLISINNDIPPLVFSSLESLLVMDWPKLTKLLDDELSLHEEIPLSQLKEMSICNCPGLTNLIPSSLCQRSMQKLECLKVEYCPMVIELFPCDERARDITELLPRLRFLNLINLQSLQNVLQPFQCLPNLAMLDINNCGVLKYVVSSEMETEAILADPFPTLEILVIRECQEMSEMISPSASLQAPCFFQRLTELQIEYCPTLKHLFTYEQAIGMQHLKELCIEYCDALEAVVISTDNKEEASSTTHVADHESYNSLFPNLRDLNLENLPQLIAFHHPTALPMQWLHLTSYKILECPKLQEPLEERIRSLRARMEKKKASSVKGE